MNFSADFFFYPGGQCWGSNEGGQLGLGDQIDRGDSAGQMGDALDAVDLGTNVTATAVALGSRHTCAIVDDGGVKCWGKRRGRAWTGQAEPSRAEPSRGGTRLNIAVSH